MVVAAAEQQLSTEKKVKEINNKRYRTKIRLEYKIETIGILYYISGESFIMKQELHFLRIHL